jgi:hypothetical protein
LVMSAANPNNTLRKTSVYKPLLRLAYGPFASRMFVPASCPQRRSQHALGFSSINPTYTRHSPALTFVHPHRH